MMDKKIKTEHFENLVAVAYADERITEEEIDFLAENALNFGLLKEDVQKVIDNAEHLKFFIPKNHEERENQLISCIHMAMTDGKVHEKEYALCLQIAEKLDFTERYLNEIIELSQKLNR
jgi:uncharacterized tellurite resistance protein B-like protein